MTTDHIVETKPIRAESPAFVFERRRARRFEALGQIDAVRADADESAREAKLNLRLLDESVTGAGFHTADPLSPGTRLDVRIGVAPAPWKSGRVVRCVATNRGYRVGVEYDRRVAA